MRIKSLVIVSVLGICAATVWLVRGYVAQEQLICIIPWPGFEEDKLFDVNDKRLNRDGVLEPYAYLKNCLNKLGYKLKATTDLEDLKKAKAVLSFDVPLDYGHIMQALETLSQGKLILFLYEPPVVKDYNYIERYHRPFSKIYTLIDSLVDNKRYFKFYYPQVTLKSLENKKPFQERKLCCMAAGNKGSRFPYELYSQRRVAISFFEQHHPTEFDLYGNGWPPSLTTYRGPVKSLLSCFNNYKFNICYENMHTVNGFMTEKIFNPMLAGAIPVYWGPANITDYVPKNCFVDRRDFKSEEELYTYMKAMDETTYQEYQKYIRAFLASPQAQRFSVIHFVDIVIRSFDPTYDCSKVFNDDERSILAAVIRA